MPQLTKIKKIKKESMTIHHLQFSRLINSHKDQCMSKWGGGGVAEWSMGLHSHRSLVCLLAWAIFKKVRTFKNFLVKHNRTTPFWFLSFQHNLLDSNPCLTNPHENYLTEWDVEILKWRYFEKGSKWAEVILMYFRCWATSRPINFLHFKEMVGDF